MENFRGQRLAIPMSAQGWLWQGTPQQAAQHDMARDIAQSIRRLAEGQQLRNPGISTPWKIIVYSMAGLFSLELLITVFSLVMSLIIR
jgi:hypothetical protein